MACTEQRNWTSTHNTGSTAGPHPWPVQRSSEAVGLLTHSSVPAWLPPAAHSSLTAAKHGGASTQPACGGGRRHPRRRSPVSRTDGAGARSTCWVVHRTTDLWVDYIRAAGLTLWFCSVYSQAEAGGAAAYRRTPSITAALAATAPDQLHGAYRRPNANAQGRGRFQIGVRALLLVVERCRNRLLKFRLTADGHSQSLLGEAGRRRWAEHACI